MALRLVLGFLLSPLTSSCCASQAPSAFRYYTPAINANATSYDYIATMGGCGYLSWNQADFGVDYLVGVSLYDFLDGEVCGMCMQVNYVGQGSTEYYNAPFFPSTKSFWVMIDNTGGNFAGWENHLDFLMYHDEKGGHWVIDWQAQACPTNNPIQWQITYGAEEWWMQILPVYQKITITQMCISVGGSWQSMVRSGGGVWQFSGMPIPNNPTVAAIAADGQVIIQQVQVTLPVSAFPAGMFGGVPATNFGPINTAGLTVPPPTCASLPAAEDTYAELAPDTGADNNDNDKGKPTTDNGGDGSLGTGGIIGVVIGSVAGAAFLVAGVLLVVGLIVLALRYRKKGSLGASTGPNYVLMTDDSTRVE